MEKTLEIEVRDGNKVHEFTFVVVESTVLSAMKREMFIAEGRVYVDTQIKELKENGNVVSVADQSAMQIVAQGLYPDLVACTKEAVRVTRKVDEEGNPLDVEPEITNLLEGMNVAVFKEYSDQFVIPWSDLVYEVNPHWMPNFSVAASEEEEGNAPRNDKR